MHYGNQILYNLDTKTLFQLHNEDSVWGWDFTQYPPNYTELVWTEKAQGGKKPGSIYVADGGLVGAEYLLQMGELMPRPKVKR